MTMASPRSLTGVIAVPRTVSSIAVTVGGLAIFLIMASVVLLSHPIGLSFQETIRGSDQIVETAVIISGRETSKGGHQDLVIKEPKSGSEVQIASDSKTPVSSDGTKQKEMVSESESNSQNSADMKEIEKPSTMSGFKNDSVEVGSQTDDNVPSSNAIVVSKNLPSAPLDSHGAKEVGTDGGSVSQNSTEVEENDKPVTSGIKNDSVEVGSGGNDADPSSNTTVPAQNLTSEPSIKSGEVASRTCDLYHGKWVYDAAGPLYTNNTCPVITQMQNCQGNGRPDKDYENWRWKPDECDLPRFDPRKFLELMRGKTLAFIGDSVARNQMESLLCILWQAETPKNRGFRRMQRWYFRSTSTTIVRIWSSWLVHRTDEAFQFAPGKLDKVHLDVPDETFMEFLPKFDVVVLSSGHWFAKSSAYILNNTIVGGQLWWPKEAGNMQVNNIEAFGISVETIMAAIATHSNFTGLAIVRSYSPDHYEGGAWNTGGSCTGKVRPADELVRNGFTDVMHEKQVTGFQRAVERSQSGGSKLKLMDITEVFGYRPDGHPGPYRSPDPKKVTKRGPHGEPPPQDCLHWCMPGPIDTWNEILMEIIRREFEKGA